MKCVLCNKSKFKIVTKELRYNIKRQVVQCKNCSLISLENPTFDNFNYAEKKYRQLHGPVLGKRITPKEMFDIQMKFQNQRFNRVKKLLRPSSKVLEIGCSTGHFLYYIKKYVKEAVGIELNKEHANFARKYCKLDVFTEPIEKTHLTQKYFDVIFLFQVFEHVSNPKEFLTLCKKYLKPTGTIYIEVPNINDALISVYDINEYKKFYYRLPHIFYYSEETLKKMLQSCGFKGTTKTVQEYSFFNHIYWMFVKGPQTTQIEGMEIPNIKLNRNSEELSKWFKKINMEYKKILEENGIGENVSFQGKVFR